MTTRSRLLLLSGLLFLFPLFSEEMRVDCVADLGEYPSRWEASWMVPEGEVTLESLHLRLRNLEGYTHDNMGEG